MIAFFRKSAERKRADLLAYI